ncbi:N-carbamoylputrescine amidase [Sesamum alatum]|uniref:N-carbamoylputrescine amidase n=1 Tax=Sesamum alatum TaxID=300844 RepID=A0AAE2CZY5_9LAMI|nr:N-carbamoylputrescine amidase [Sesamum alatum]
MTEVECNPSFFTQLEAEGGSSFFIRHLLGSVVSRSSASYGTPRAMGAHLGSLLDELRLVPLVASNRIGKEIIDTEHGKSKIAFYGNSFIAGPTAEIIASADDKEVATLTAQFDLGKIKYK